MNRSVFLLTCLLGCKLECDTGIKSVPVDIKIEDSGVEKTIIDSGIDTPKKMSCHTPFHQEILMVGDSETGFASWSVDKVKRASEHVVADSHPGTTLTYWNSGHFVQVLGNHQKPDVLIIYLGTCNYNFPYLPDISNIISEIERLKVPCIWSGPTDVYGREWMMNALLKEKVSNLCHYIDVHTLHIELSDGVHPTKDGAIKWLTEVWRVKDEMMCHE